MYVYKVNPEPVLPPPPPVSGGPALGCAQDGHRGEQRRVRCGLKRRRRHVQGNHHNITAHIHIYVYMYIYRERFVYMYMYVLG